jgi:hypothetical protein
MYGMVNKRIVIMQFLFFLSLRVYPFEYRNNLGLGILGIGVSFENESPGGYFFGNVINFTCQSSSGFGVNVSPLHFSTYTKNPELFSLTFINVSVFYNFLDNEHFILGPFGSISAINYNCPDLFELHAGITFSIRNIDFFGDSLYNDSKFGFDFLVVELGYKYNNKGIQGFYASIGMDLLTALYYHAKAGKDDVKEYQKEPPVY